MPLVCRAIGLPAAAAGRAGARGLRRARPLGGERALPLRGEITRTIALHVAPPTIELVALPMQSEAAIARRARLASPTSCSNGSASSPRCRWRSWLRSRSTPSSSWAWASRCPDCRGWDAPHNVLDVVLVNAKSATKPDEGRRARAGEPRRRRQHRPEAARLEPVPRASTQREPSRELQRGREPRAAARARGQGAHDAHEVEGRGGHAPSSRRKGDRQARRAGARTSSRRASRSRASRRRSGATTRPTRSGRSKKFVGARASRIPLRAVRGQLAPEDRAHRQPQLSRGGARAQDLRLAAAHGGRSRPTARSSRSRSTAPRATRCSTRRRCASCASPLPSSASRTTSASIPTSCTSRAPGPSRARDQVVAE